MKFTFAPETTPLAGYTIKRAIDRGGFGEVYYALSDSGKEVALKLLQRNQQIELRGVRQCLNLKHPNLVTIFDIRTDADDDHWVVMEFVSGKSLEQVLEDNPKGLPVADAEAWLSGIAAGIGFLHDRGIVHRDLKPANVFRENGVVKIGDVGLSKFITPSRRSVQTESVGTVYYMAPEVAHGKYGSELDVYSLGIILFEMLTGQVPFQGESTGEILMKHLTEPPDLSKIEPRFRPVLARALEKDPQRRTPGVVHLAEEFRRACQGKAVAEEIPATHFVDVQRLERKVALDSQPGAGAQRVPVQIVQNGAAAANGARSGHAHTLPYPQAPGSPPPGSTATAPKTESPKTGWQFFSEEFQRNPWLATSVIIAFLVVFPGFGRGIPFSRFSFGFLMPAAVVYLGYWFVTRMRPHLLARGWKPFQPAPWCANAGRTPAAAPITPPVVATPVAMPQVVRTAPKPPPVLPVLQPVAAKKVQVQLTPKTVRPVSLRGRLSDLSSSMTMAVLWSLVATGVIGATSSHLSSPRGKQAIVDSVNAMHLLDPAHAGLFALTTILGAWAVLLPAKIQEGRGIGAIRRRLIAASLGAAVGACAWWVGDTLFVEPQFESAFRNSLFDRVFHQPLLASNRAPTLAGYVAFFSSLFVVRRWWWQADAFRPNRFRIRSWVWTGVVAFFIPALFAFPQGWGVNWALAISAVVQLSAPWVASKDRPAIVEAKNNATA